MVVAKAFFKLILEIQEHCPWPRRSLQGVEFDTENLLVAFDEVASLPETPEAQLSQSQGS